jgi:hypothetical protein
LENEILKIALGAISGALITAFGYTLAFSTKFAALQTTVNNLVTLMNRPVTIPPEIIQKLTEVCTTAKELEKRVDKLESKNEK